jgi:hypothetical protein
MGWRSRLEDKYTVTCFKCGCEWVNPWRRNRQKWGLCPTCAKNPLKCKNCDYEESLDEGMSKSAYNTKSKWCHQCNSSVMEYASSV